VVLNNSIINPMITKNNYIYHKPLNSAACFRQLISLLSDFRDDAPATFTPCPGSRADGLSGLVNGDDLRLTAMKHGGNVICEALKHGMMWGVSPLSEYSPPFPTMVRDTQSLLGWE
jgi:hypothetical protein